MNRSRSAVLAALLLLGGSGAGIAQVAAAGAAPATNAKHDSNAPVDFDADRIEVQDRDHKATLIGNVHMVQDDMTLTSDRAIILYTGSAGGTAPAAGQPAGDGGSPKAQRLDASGHVVVVRPGEIAKGNYGIYDLQTKIITLIGNVSLDRNGSVVRGGRLVIDQNTNRATIDGAAVGGAGSTGKGGRVSGRFIVNQTSDSGTPTTPAAPTAKPKP